MIKNFLFNIVEAKYLNNHYMLERVKKEYAFLEKRNRLQEIEILLTIKDELDINLVVSESSFLTLYLLYLSPINPMPAHYYNKERGKISFANYEKYGLDLPDKMNYIKDGFNIIEDYILNLDENFIMELYIDEKYEKDILKIIEKFNVKYSNFTGNSTIKDKFDNFIRLKTISFNYVRIFLKDSKLKLNFNNIYDEIDEKEFKTFLCTTYYINEFLKKKTTFYEDYSEEYYFMTKRNYLLSFKDFLYYQGLRKTEYKINGKIYDKNYFLPPRVPANIQDIFIYLKYMGYNNREAAYITKRLSFGLEVGFKSNDEGIKDYINSISHIWPKGKLILRLFRAYFNKDEFFR